MPRKTEQHSIVTEELWNNVLNNNKTLLRDFIEYCQSKDMSPTTIDGYEGDIKICLVWNLSYNNNKFFVDFTKRDIMRYQNWMVNDLKLSSNRVRRLKSAISSLSNYIESILDDEYKGFKNIVNKIPAPPKQEAREKTVLTDEQIDFLLNELIKREKYQQACALALAVSSGSRKSELLRFKVSYFTDENIKYGALYKTPEKMKTKGRSSKGKHIFRYVLVSKFKPYFDLWIKERERLGIEGDDLFWNKYDKEIKPSNISMLNSYAITFSNILGVDFYWHSLRHYFCTSLCKANIPSDVVKDIIGWDSIAMVSLYNDIEVDEEISKYFNEDGIKITEKKSLSSL
jgi:site-specific recombinase XerD